MMDVVIQDPRISESSGLAWSLTDPTVAYTMDDEYETPQVIAVELDSGDTAGSFSFLGYKVKDPETIRVHPIQCNVWLGDTGDNDNKRKDCAFYVVPDLGRGDHGALETIRYPYHFKDKKGHNVEAAPIHPMTGRVYLIEKSSKGHLWSMPLKSSTTTSNQLVDQKANLGKYISDAAFGRSGKFLFCRQKDVPTTILVINATTWKKAGDIKVEKVAKPESLDVSPDGTEIAYGSEGLHSPIKFVTIPSKWR